MNKLLITFLISFVNWQLALSQPCQIYITLDSQQEVNNFPSLYPCTEHTSGTITIEGNDITNLDSLYRFIAISGLEIDGTSLANLNGLYNLKTINRLVINQNKRLKNLEGLSNVDTIRGNFFISKNDSLLTLEQTNSIKYIGGYLIFQGNQQLTSMNGFDNLDYIGGNLELNSAGGFTDPNFIFDKLKNIKGDVFIRDNHLANFNGLNSLDSIGGRLSIYGCDQLVDFGGFENLIKIGGKFRIYDNEKLLGFSGFNKLKQIGDWFEIYENNSLKKFASFNALEHVESRLTIRDNDSLSVINGFHKLESMADNITIQNNNLLDSVLVFWNLKSAVTLNLLGENISYIADFDSLQSVGEFVISHTKIKTIPYANNLTHINDKLEITQNDSLISLHIDQFDQLKTVGSISISSNSNLVQLSGFDSLKIVSGSVGLIDNPNLNSLNGFMNNVTTINKGLSIRGTEKMEFILGFNKLSKVGELPFSGTLSITNNTSLKNLNGFHNLKSTLGLSISNNASLENFNGLDSLRAVGINPLLGSVSIHNNPSIKNFKGLDNLQSIGYQLYIGNNNSLKNLNGLDSLQRIGNQLYIGNNNSLKNLNGLDSLQLVGNFLTVVENDSLTNIQSLENVNLEILEEKLEIFENPQLSICHSQNICDFIANHGPWARVIHDNGPNCNSSFEIINGCDGLHALHHGYFYDFNQNGVWDVNEPQISNPSAIQINSINVSGFNQQGNLSIYLVDEGTYTVRYSDAILTDWNITSQEEYIITFFEDTPHDTVVFGLFPKVFYSDLTNSIYMQPTRCNENIFGQLTLSSQGTNIISGTLWFTVDEDVSINYFSPNPDTLISPNVYGWHFDSLMPGNYINPYFGLHIPGPPDFNVGEDLNFTLFSEFSDQDSSQTTDLLEYNSIIACSFDPNDKLVQPDRSTEYNGKAYTLFDEELIFTIRFQNTGNDKAINIEILDTLDTNLDFESFRVLNSRHSHVLNTTVSDWRFVKFEFKNINLPDSTTNLSGSQSYVSYSVRAKNGLSELTEIKNSASIYFDYNPPILTNTTNNIMVEELPIVSNIASQIHTKDSFSITPNPSHKMIQLHGGNIKNATVEIFNFEGIKLLEMPFQDGMLADLKDFPSGIYIIRLIHKNSISTQKLILLN